MHQLLAVLRRDWREAWEKRSPLLIQCALVLLLPTALALVASAWIPQWNQMEARGALVLALVVMDALWTATVQWSRSMYLTQVRGELEALLATGARLGTLLVITPGFQALSSLVRCVLYVLLMMGLYGARFETSQLHGALLFVLLAGFAFGAMGVLSMSLTLAMRNREPFGPLFWMLNLLIGGVLTPLAHLPGWLQPVGASLPQGALLRGLRGTLLRAEPLEQLTEPLLSLSLSTAVMLALAWWVARHTRLLLLREGFQRES